MAGKRIPKVERGWFGTEDAANYLGISKNSVTAAARSGRLRAKLGPGADLTPSRNMKTCRAWCDEFMESFPDYTEKVVNI